VEWIAIHKHNEKAIVIADKVMMDLMDYPVADENDFSSLEDEYAEDLWNTLPIDERVELCQEYNCNIFSARHDTIPQDDSGGLFDYLVTP